APSVRSGRLSLDPCVARTRTRRRVNSEWGTLALPLSSAGLAAGDDRAARRLDGDPRVAWVGAAVLRCYGYSFHSPSCSFQDRVRSRLVVASTVRGRHTPSCVSCYEYAAILLHRHTRDGTISDVKNTDLIEDQRTRVALYVRVSLDRREKASVEEQLDDLRLTVDRLGWDIVAELADNDVPASRYSKA